MSPQNARIAVLPRDVASEVAMLALSRATWVVSIVILVIIAPVVVDTILRRAEPTALVVPLASMAVMLGLLAYTGVRPGIASRIVFLIAGGVIGCAYTASVVAVDPTLSENAAALVNRIAMVLVLVSPGISRPVAAVAWAFGGYLVGTASILIADLATGAVVNFGWGPTITLAISLSLVVALSGVRNRHPTLEPDLRRLEAETSRLALEYQYEQRAAAVIHDTVLGDLTVIMNATGPLDERSRERFQADVATLSDASWLRESRAAMLVDAADTEVRNGMVALASEMQWRGLTVDITGDPELEGVRLSSDKIVAVHAAVRACLENVLAHAGTRSAELVLGADADGVTAMVIDHGVGFDPEAVPEDRLGLRASVIRRIESLGGSVRVWSKPGSGTSVMLSMPSDVVLPALEEAP